MWAADTDLKVSREHLRPSCDALTQKVHVDEDLRQNARNLAFTGEAKKRGLSRSLRMKPRRGRRETSSAGREAKRWEWSAVECCR